MDKKKIITALLMSVMLTSGVGEVHHLTTPVTVAQAASKRYVTVRGKKRIRLYTAKGRKTKSFASPRKKYVYHARKRIRIGKKSYLAYKLSSNRYLLAKNALIVVSPSRITRSYKEAHLTLPAGYTRARLLEAYRGHPSSAFVQSCIKGMTDNQFNYAEAPADDDMIIQPGNLTADQTKELAEFSLKLINEVRSQLGLPSWVYSEGTQKLANDIAQEYTSHGRSIRDGRHYVAGIVRACKKNGLELNDNYVEDMAGFNQQENVMTMTMMKRNVYFGLKQMIFGYAGENENSDQNISNYREWGHAGDLFNTQGSRHDGDYNYYGFSVSKTGTVYSLHYISVPSFVVNSTEYNRSFRP